MRPAELMGRVLEREENHFYVATNEGRYVGIIVPLFGKVERPQSNLYNRLNCRGLSWWREAELNCRHKDFQSSSLLRVS